MPTVKASFTTQLEAANRYGSIVRDPSLDVDVIRINGKVITITCRELGLLIDITNQVFQPVAEFIVKITITEA